MRTYLLVFLIFAGCCIVSDQVWAEVYSFEQLVQVAEDHSPQLERKKREIEGFELELSSLLANYRMSWEFGGTFFAGGSEVDDQVDYTLETSTSWTPGFLSGLHFFATAKVPHLFEEADGLYSAGVRYQIYPGKKSDPVEIELNRKRNAIEQAKTELQDERDMVYLTLWHKFHATLILQETLQWVREEEVFAAQELEMYRRLYEKGSCNEREMLQKELDVKNAAVAVEQVRHAYLVGLADVFSYAGIEPETSAQITEEISQGALAGSLDHLAQIHPEELMYSLKSDGLQEDELISLALSNRSEVKKIELEIGAVKEELKMMAATKGFELGSELAVNDAPITGFGWKIGVTASYQFTAGRKNQIELDKGQLLLGELEQSLQDAQSTLASEVKTLVSKCKVAFLECEIAKLNLAQGKLDYRYLQEQHKAGMVKDDKMKSAQCRLQRVELAYLQKVVDLQYSIWKLEQYVY